MGASLDDPEYFEIYLRFSSGEVQGLAATGTRVEAEALVEARLAR